MQKCRLLAGATLAAAKSLLSGKFKIAINWQGGWHHARKTAAAGFCYVNDINIAIRYILKSTFYTKRVLYIDLDLHHGDGVESEFHKLRQVVTLSLHHFSDGFYPGTGSMSSQTGYAINVPLPEKVGDGDWTELATFAVTKAVDSFDPEYFVVQCGADSLFNDPHKTLCISQDAYFNVLARIKRFGKPTLVLGGGGYNEVATAKLWTNLTAKLCGFRLLEDIPDSDDYFDRYGPDFTIFEKNEIFEKIAIEKMDELKNHVLTCCSKITNHQNENKLTKLSSRPNFKRRKLMMD